ncbi:MAG: tetratricopeptide repeat protein [Candidatus Odinarchaeota archaeon]
MHIRDENVLLDSVDKELLLVETLIDGEKYDDGLSIIEKLEKRKNLAIDEQISCQLLKCTLLNRLGRYKETLTLAEDTLAASRSNGKHLQVIDASIQVAEALFRLGRYDESLATIDKANSELTALTCADMYIIKRKAFLYHWKAWNYLRQGLLDQSIDLFEQSLELRKKIGSKRFIAGSMNSIGNAYLMKGELDQALDYYQKSLEQSKDIKQEQVKAITYTNIGEIYRLKGELDQAQDYYQKSLTIYEKTGNKQFFAIILGNMGHINYQRGELNRALDYFQKSLVLFQETVKGPYIAENLFYLILTCTSLRNLDLAKDYLLQLQQVNDSKNNRLVNQFYRVAEAIVLKSSSRARSRGKAEELLEEVIEEKIIYHELTVHALLQLCDLLLLDLKISGDKEVLGEVKTLTNQLLKIATQQHSHRLLVETYLFQSKLALLELNIDRAKKLLSQAYLTAEEKGLKKLSIATICEQDMLLSQLNRWEQIIDQTPAIHEIIELTQLDNLIERMIHRKSHRDEEEIKEYVIKAKKLIKEWKKEVET